MTDSQQFLWLLPIVIWDLVWKGIALWRARGNNQRNWFIALLILNTAGILPLIYLRFFSKPNLEKTLKL